MENVWEQQSRWFKLDNAAKIYPAILNPKDSCVYRVSAYLFSDVRPSVLRQALIDCKPRFPSLYVKLKRGFFWNYYEPNEKTPLLKPESPYINNHICPYANNGYLFTLFYFKNRVSLEVFHGLCDGCAALELLKSLLHRYFVLQGYPEDAEGKVLTPEQPPRAIELEDSYIRHYRPVKDRLPKIRPAYRINGTRFPYGIGAVNGRMPVDRLAALAKANGATVTQYLAALLTLCIRRADDMTRQNGKSVNICVPVNLRGFYESQSLRNFSLYFYVSTPCDGGDESFEDILRHVKLEFRDGLCKDKLQQRLNANVAIERNLALRAAPLFIKKAAIKFACVALGDKRNTCALSNVGRIELPSWMSSVVKSFECNPGVGNEATHSVALNTFGGVTTVSFTRSIYETEIERLFFSHLAEQGVDIEIQSNLWEDCV